MGKNFSFLGLVWVSVALLYSSCEETNTIGFPTGEQKIQTIFLDTFTVKTSTILLDSISTIASGRTLAGEYHDAVFGKTIASSFFQLGTLNITSFAPAPAATFDSISLILKYDKYYYGDTTQVQQLQVSELSEMITERTFPPLEPEDRSFFYTGLLFNNSKTKTSATPLGSINYTPRPLRDTAVFIRLNDQKGKDWFDIAKGADKSQLSGNNFLELFKGVKLSTTTPSNAAVIGFATDATLMRIYYSETDGEGVVTQKYFDFKVINTTLQYNQILTDRTGTPLQNLVAGSAVSSELTNNETFIQGGAGVLTKIEFPNFKYLVTDNERFMILSARLVIKPVETPEKHKEIPSDLALLFVSSTDIPTGVMPRDFDGQPQAAELRTDKEFNRNTEYSFSMIQYIDALVNRTNNISPYVILSMPAATFPKSVNQLRIGDGLNQNFKIKLEIYLSRLN